MTRHVAVIGDGAAGAAAAWRARQAGARVTIVSAGAGASALAGGAIDDAPWDEVVRAAGVLGAELLARPLDAGVRAFAEALGLWRIPAEGEALPLVATTAGRVRPARGHDRALLDLGAIPAGSVVAVPRVDRAGWDADSLAAAWSDDPLARRRELRFVAVPVDVLLRAGDDRIGDADLAARHDDPVRLAWLASRLREGLGRSGKGARAAILGPWLGLDAPRAAALSEIAGVPVGEALAGAGGPAGFRFARARDRLLERAGVARVRARVTRVSLPDGGERATLEGDGMGEPLDVDRVVLACGGLAAGGIVYEPLDVHAGTDVAEASAPPFRLSFEVDAPLAARPYLAARGARVDVTSSMFGPDLDLSAWPEPTRPGVLEAIGVACDDRGLAAPRLAVAGDAAADRPRTLLVAVESGLLAGAWAALEHG